MQRGRFNIHFEGDATRNFKALLMESLSIQHTQEVIFYDFSSSVTLFDIL